MPNVFSSTTNAKSALDSHWSLQPDRCCATASRCWESAHPSKCDQRRKRSELSHPTMTVSRTMQAKGTRATKRPRRDHGGTLLGIFIGLVIGLGMAASVAFWLMKNNPAFQTAASATTGREPAGKETPRM